MTISEPAVILGAGTAVLAILFGARVAMRATAGGAEAPPTGDAASTAGGSGAPDVAGVIALPPLIFLAFLVAATVLEAVVPLPLFAGHALARYLAGAALAVRGLHVALCGRRHQYSIQRADHGVGRRRYLWANEKSALSGNDPHLLGLERRGGKLVGDRAGGAPSCG
jgi:hypothetical protein